MCCHVSLDCILERNELYKDCFLKLYHNDEYRIQLGIKNSSKLGFVFHSPFTIFANKFAIIDCNSAGEKKLLFAHLLNYRKVLRR